MTGRKTFSTIREEFQGDRFTARKTHLLLDTISVFTPGEKPSDTRTRTRVLKDDFAFLF